MFRVLLSLFVSFFVHFQKLIRPHPGPLWGGGVAGPLSSKRLLKKYFFGPPPLYLRKKLYQCNRLQPIIELLRHLGHFVTH